MHCYRCGRRVPDRSPRCENCGQKFNFGPEPAARQRQDPVPEIIVPVAPVEAVPPSSGLSESIFEVSKTSRNSRDSRDSRPSAPTDNSGSGPSADPTVASMALTEATEQAVISFGSAPPRRLGEASAEEPIPLPPETGTGAAAPSATAPAAGTGGELAVGKSISGRLEIVADLGSGPLGRVFKAVDRKKGTTVAVKAIPAARLPAEALSGKFAETVNLVKGLTHPNLVKVHGAGREGDTAFTIMQYLEGLPLRSLLDVKRENGATFGFEEAEPIIAQICQGLSFAHAAQTPDRTVLVHGGIKPENVFVQVDSLKLIDLGTARLFAPAEWRALQARGPGGGAYLAPEYSWSVPRIDRRADVYSVGAIVYEMLTGRPPSGPDAPSVSSLNPSVPRAVDRVVAKAMAARPEDRFESASDLKEAIFRVLGGDILADDIESPMQEHGETFAEQPIEEETSAEDAPGIEIEYVEAEQATAASRGMGGTAIGEERDRVSDDMTPVGAIELHEPLWEPDEIREQQSRSSGGEPKGGPVPVRTEISARGMANANLPAPLPPSMPEEVSVSVSGLGSGDHQSVDLEGGGEDATVAGMEPSQAPADALAGRPGERRTPSWLERVEEPDPRSRDSQVPTEPAPGLPPPANPLPPEPKVERVSLSPRTIPPVRRQEANEVSFGVAESTPLELDGSAPTAPRQPSPTPAPWDSAARRTAATSDLGPDRSERDRPTDPRGPPPAPNERATAPRPRPDDNPTARALSPPSPPPLELTFSEANGAGPDAHTDAPTAPLNTPRRPQASNVTVAKPDPPARRYDPPAAVTMDGPLDAPPRRTMIARRAPSRAPVVIAVLAIAAALGGGGFWYVQQQGEGGGGKPVIVPAAGPKCPEGMIAFEAGTFKQGSDKLDPDRDVFEPLLQDAKVGAFCVDRFEHPNEEGATPTTGVDYASAAASCAEAGKRLCTETEWERACKGGANSRFAFGDSFKPGICNVGSDAPKPVTTPAPIGAFASCGTEDGPRDMSGNVWELTSSAWPEDASARVIKGGSAKVPAWGARCAYRDFVALSKPAPDVGFRCCKDPG